MTMTMRDFWAMEVDNTTVALHQRMQFTHGSTASTGSAVSYPAESTPPSGCEGGERTLLVPSINSAQGYVNTEQFTAPDDGTYWVNDIYVKFDDVAMATYGPGYIDFLICRDSNGDVEWKLRIDGGTGAGYTTHRLLFIDSNGSSTQVHGDPFTNNVYSKVSVRWPHNSSSVVYFKLDDADPDTAFVSTRDLRFDAGTVRDVYFEINGMVEDPAFSHTDMKVWLLTFSTSTTADDLPTTKHGKMVITPEPSATTAADCDEAGNSPGDALASGDAQDPWDEASTGAGITTTVTGTQKGSAWGCHRDRAKGGPRGRLKSDSVTLMAVKYMWFFDNSSTTNTALPYAVWGKYNGTTFTVSTANAPYTRNNKRYYVTVEPVGDTECPDLSEWAVIGMENSASGGTGTITFEEGKVVAIYDASANDVDLIVWGKSAIEGDAALNA